MSRVAAQLDELRDVVGEIDTLAAFTLDIFDRADWGDADRQLVERMAYALGMIARTAALAASKLDGFHVAVADVQPVPAGVQWDDNRVTGSAPGEDAPARDAEIIEHDAAIVRRLRERLAEALNAPIGHPFFYRDWLPGEDPDVALLRIFRSNKAVLDRSDDDVINALVEHARRRGRG